MEANNPVYIVYKTTNLINSHIYIGHHKQYGDPYICDGYFGSGNLIKKAIEKYGINNFSRETLFYYSDIESARKMEATLVNEEFLKRKDVYNMAPGGTGGNLLFGKTKQQIKEIAKKARITIEQRGRKPRTQEQKERASQSAKLRIQNYPHTLPDNKNRIFKPEGLSNIQKANKEKIGKYHWITNGKEMKCQLKVDPIPDGWYEGRGEEIPRFKEHSNESRSKIANHENIKGIICYTNGTINLKLKSNEIPPPGFYKGMRQKREPRIWITNGEESYQLLKGLPIPEGYYKGRVFKK